jgi:hypothetical protein
MKKYSGLAKKLFACIAVAALVAVNANTISVFAATALIDNTGFEDGMGTWAPFGNCSVELTSDEKFGGNNAVFVSKRGETGSGPSQDITGEILPGKTYKVTAKVKYTDGPDTRDFFVSVRNGVDWTGITNMAPGTITKGEWGTIEGTYTLPDGADLQQSIVFVETSWTAEQDPVNDLMNYYVDDVSVEEVAADAAADVTAATAAEATTDDAAADNAAAEAPKTGDVSVALYYGMGAVASFIGVYRLKRKNNK